jgi:hypothetical protein
MSKPTQDSRESLGKKCACDTPYPIGIKCRNFVMLVNLVTVIQNIQEDKLESNRVVSGLENRKIYCLL